MQDQGHLPIVELSRGAIIREARTRPETRVEPALTQPTPATMTNPQLQPPEEPVPLSRLLVWGAIAVVLVLGIWLYVRYGRAVAPLINS